MSEKIIDLCLYRMQNAIDTLEAAKLCMERNYYKDTINRCYYAAKSMQDDNGRRFYLAWAHDRADQSDRGEWY